MALQPVLERATSQDAAARARKSEKRALETLELQRIEMVEEIQEQFSSAGKNPDGAARTAGNQRCAENLSLQGLSPGPRGAVHTYSRDPGAGLGKFL